MLESACPACSAEVAQDKDALEMRHRAAADLERKRAGTSSAVRTVLQNRYSTVQYCLFKQEACGIYL